MNVTHTIDPKNGDVIITFELQTKLAASIAAYATSDNHFVCQVMNPTILDAGKQSYRWNRRSEMQELIASGYYRFDIATYAPGNNGDLFPIDWFLLCNSSKHSYNDRLLGGSPYADLLYFNDRLFICREFGETHQLVNYSLLSDLQESKDAINGFAHQGVTKISTNGTLIYIQCYADAPKEQQPGGNIIRRISFITAFDPATGNLHDFGQGNNLVTPYGSLPAIAITPYDFNNETKVSEQGGLEHILAMAVQPGDGLLFQLQKDVSGEYSRLLAYKNATLLYTTPINDTTVRECKFDGQGNLWLLYAEQIRKFTITNTAVTSTSTEITGIGDGQRFCFSPDYSYLEVTDKATHQLKRYSTATGALLNSLFVGGGYANGPSVDGNKFKIDKFSSIAILPDGRRFLYEALNRRTVLQTITGDYIDTQQMHDSLIETCMDRNNRTRMFCNGQEWHIDETSKVWPTSAKLVNHWAANLPLYPTPSFRNVVTINGITLALMETNDNPKLVKLVDGVGVQETGYVCDTRSVELYSDGLHSMETYVNPADGLGLRTDINFRSITVAKNGSIAVGDFQRLATLPGTGNTPYYNGNPGTLSAWEKLDEDRMVIWQGGKKEAGFHHLGIYSLSQKKFLHVGIPSTGTDWFGTFPKNLPLYDSGDGSNYPAARARVIDKYIVVAFQMQFYGGGNYGGLSYASEYKLFDEDLMYLGNFGKNGGEVEREYIDSTYQTLNYDRIANSALTQYLFKLPNGKIRLYTGEDGPHCANQCYELTLPQNLVKSSELVAIPALPESPVYLNQLDLMAGIPFGKPIGFENGMGGWAATPAPFYNNGSDYFSITAGIKSQNFPSLFVSFSSTSNRVNVLESPAINKSGLTRWLLYFTVGFFNNPSNTTYEYGSQGESTVRIYDIAGKLLCKLDYRYARPHYKSIAEIALNEATIWRRDQPNNPAIYKDDMNEAAIGWDTNGLFLILAGRKTGYTPLYDNTANAANWGKLTLHFEQNNGNKTFSTAIGAGRTNNQLLLMYS